MMTVHQDKQRIDFACSVVWQFANNRAYQCVLTEHQMFKKKVELRGIEPLSKHIPQKLSTCLFHYCLSAMSRK